MQASQLSLITLPTPHAKPARMTLTAMTTAPFTSSQPSLITLAAAPLRLYRVTLAHQAVEIMAKTLADALRSVSELYPGELVLSALVVPEWGDE